MLYSAQFQAAAVSSFTSKIKLISQSTVIRKPFLPIPLTNALWAAGLDVPLSHLAHKYMSCHSRSPKNTFSLFCCWQILSYNSNSKILFSSIKPAPKKARMSPKQSAMHFVIQPLPSTQSLESGKVKHPTSCSSLHLSHIKDPCI